ncbi:MAG: ectonucleotide pyrophosphatase/phosphodiesterase [Xanthomonadales bacterium]
MPQRCAPRLWLPAVLLLLLPLAGCHAPATRSAPADDAITVVLVSIDGFRWDFDRFAETPTLDRMARSGLKARALQPAYPTLTFPNHYSIATGLLPQHHGIVANSFPDATRKRWYRMSDRAAVQDGRWYAGEPVWVTAEKQGLRSAAYYFVGTEADIDGVRPTYWRLFDAAVPGEARVRQVLRWLRLPAAERPRFVTLYFEAVDSQTHAHGVGSAESIAAIEEVDRLLGALQAGLADLPFADRVALIVVSDHGMGSYGTVAPLELDRVIDLDGVRVVEGGSYAFLYFETDRDARARQARAAINSAWRCGQALLPTELPAAWRAGPSDRFPDLFVQPDPGCGVISTGKQAHRMTAADHGWPPDAPDMHGILYATGPRIPAGRTTGPVHVTDIQPLLIELLGLAPPGPGDGDPRRLTSLLEPVSR